MKKFLKAMGFTLALMLVTGVLFAAGSREAAPVSETGRPTITAMVMSFYGTDLANEHSDKVIQQFSDYTNTTVNFQWENNDVYTEKIGLTLLDVNNMPMLIVNSGNLTANVVDAAKKGAFWDLAPFLEDTAAYPNLSQYNRGVASGFTVDGKMIGIYRGRELGRNGMSYRQDWADKVGVTKAPQTIDEFYDMIYKFTYNDPDGNGKRDTFGIELTKYVGPWDIMQTWFGVGNGWVEQGGKLVPVHQTAEFMTALKWFRKIYSEGLVRPDWPSVDTGTYGNAIRNGQAGVLVDVMDSGRRIWDYFETNKIPSVTDPSKIASMNLLGPINNKTLATAGHNGYMMISKAGAKTEQDVKNVLHFLDKMNDNVMLVLADRGLEGIQWNFDDEGYVIPITPSPYTVQNSPQLGLNQVVAYIPNTASTDPTTKLTEREVAQNEAYYKMRPLAVTNPAAGLLPNSTVQAEVGTQLAQILEDARTQYICGVIDDAGLQAAFKTWADRGGTRLIAEINALR